MNLQDPFGDIQQFCFQRNPEISLFHPNGAENGLPVKDTEIMDDVMNASHLLLDNPAISDEVLDGDIEVHDEILRESKDLLITMKAKTSSLQLDLDSLIPGNGEEAIVENDISEIMNNNVLLQNCGLLQWNLNTSDFVLMPLDALQQSAILDEEAGISTPTSTHTYQCNVCGSDFDEMPSLMLHYQQVHQLFKCPFCVKHFSRSYILKEHLFVHTDRCEFECSRCMKQFKRRRDLRRHIIRLHSKPLPSSPVIFLCDSCGFQTKTKTSIRKHVLSHLVKAAPHPRRYVCDICDKRCKNEGDLTDHRNTHFNIKPYQCDVCNTCFTRKQALVMHRRTQHDGLYSFVCNICGRNFPYKTSLVVHLQLHNGENLVECDVCGKKMSGKTALLNHKKIHTQQRDFVCGLCGKMYINKYSLQEHLLVHTGSKPFQCLQCDNSFSSRKKLLMHERIHDPLRTQYRCSYCEKSYLTKFKLKAHVTKHHPSISTL